MSKQLRVFNAAILGTSLMTAFSYLFSYLSGNDTREPELNMEIYTRRASFYTGSAF